MSLSRIVSVVDRNIHWILRWLIIFGSMARFYFSYSPDVFPVTTTIIISYIFYMFYALLVSVKEVQSQSKVSPADANMANLGWDKVELIVDIIFFTWLYYLTKSADSDFFLFYFLPLLIASEKLDEIWILGSFLAVTFAATIIILVNSTYETPIEAIIRIVFPRVVFYFFTLYIAAARSTRLRLRDRRLQQITVITEKINKTTTRKQLLETIVDQCFEFFGGLGVNLRLADERSLNIAASSRRFMDIVSKEDSVIPEDYSSEKILPAFVHVFKTGKAQIFNRANQDPHFENLIKTTKDKEQLDYMSEIRGFACFPFMFEEKVIGILTIRVPDEGYFSSNIIADIKLIMQSSEIAYRNVVRRDNLIQATHKLHHENSDQVLLEEIVQNASKILNATGGKIYLFNKDRSKLILRAVEGIATTDLLNIGNELDPDEGMVGQVVKYKIPQITDEYSEEPYAVDRLKHLFKAVVEVPLTHKSGEVIGALAVINNNDNRKPFNDEDRTLLEHFAQHASLALENLALHDREHLLDELARKINSELERDIRNITKIALEYLEKLIYLDTASIQIKYGDYLNILDCFGFGHDVDTILALRFEITPDIPNTVVMETNKPLIANELPEKFPEAMTKPGMENVIHWMGVPLLVKDETVGMITIDRHINNLPFTESDANIVMSFASHIAIALSNSQLYKTAEAQRNALKVLYDANQVANGVFDLQISLEKIAELALDLVQKQGHLQGGFSHIALVKSNTIFYMATYPTEKLSELKEKGLESINLKEPRKRYGIVSRVVSSKKPETVPDVSEDEDYLGFDEEIRSQLSIPILLAGNLLGVISVLHPDIGFFTAEDIKNLSFLAENAAAVIRLFHTLNVNLGLSTFTIPIHHQLHETRRIFNNSKLTLEAIREAPHTPNEIRLQIAETLEELATISIAQDDLPKEVSLKSEKISLLSFLETILSKHKNYQALAVENRTISTLRDYSVFCDFYALAFVINNVLDNAITAMKLMPEENNQIHIRLIELDEGVEIEIENNGQRFLYDILLNVYRNPIRKVNDEETHLSLGALISSLTIELFNGKIDVKSSTAEKTIISLWLPLSNPSEGE